ncbi:MAG: HPr family phosphocarrier protein [Nanoarchaeota archaeon]|nr:HPr family phosphocarrier protein [Nanoarchaeota archaeon]
MKNLSEHNLPLYTYTKVKDDEFQLKFEISNQLGLHARPAVLFVQLANKFQSEIFVEKEGKKVKGKNIIGIMTLAASKGEKITVTAQGKDAEQYLDKLTNLIESKFDED